MRQRERRLPHAGPRRDDDQVARLEAAGQPVDVAVALTDAGDVGAGLVELRDPLEALLQERLDVAELGRDPALRELEDDLLGPVDEPAASPGRSQPELRDLAADADEPAQGRHLADDLRVVAAFACGHERGELVDRAPTAASVEVAALLELVDQRDRVDRLASGVQRERRRVDLGVALPVEVARVEDFADRPDRTGGRASSPRGRTPSASRFCGGTGAVCRLDDCGHV